jgi:hypothetical protein
MVDRVRLACLLGLSQLTDGRTFCRTSHFGRRHWFKRSRERTFLARRNGGFAFRDEGVNPRRRSNPRHLDARRGSDRPHRSPHFHRDSTGSRETPGDAKIPCCRGFERDFRGEQTTERSRPSRDRLRREIAFALRARRHCQRRAVLGPDRRAAGRLPAPATLAPRRPAGRQAPGRRRFAIGDRGCFPLPARRR